MEALWKAGAQYRRKKRSNRYYSYDLQSCRHLADDRWKRIRAVCQYRLGLQNSSLFRLRSSTTIPGAHRRRLRHGNPKSEVGELNAGFRAEHTNQIYTMLQHFRNMGQVGEQSYWDTIAICIHQMDANQEDERASLLLSLHQQVRASMRLCLIGLWARSTQEKGNPNLKRARIDNIDLRWGVIPRARQSRFLPACSINI